MRAYELYEKLDLASSVLHDGGGDGRLTLRNLNRLKRFRQIRWRERQRKLATIRTMYGNDAIQKLAMMDEGGNDKSVPQIGVVDPEQGAET